VLKPSGGIKVTKDGTVVENLDIRGNVVIDAQDVTFRNVRVHSTSSAYSFNAYRGTSGVTLEHVEVVIGNCANAGLSLRSDATVRYSKITGCGDGIKAGGGGLYEYNYIAVAKSGSSSKHLDGIQGSGASNYTIRNNVINVPPSVGGNSAIFIQAYDGSSDRPISNIRVENNWLDGGNYTVFVHAGKSGTSGLISDVRVDDNRFGTDHRYGALTMKSGATASGNVWDATGLPIR
jgi:hypothetical protein